METVTPKTPLNEVRLKVNEVGFKANSVDLCVAFPVYSFCAAEICHTSRTLSRPQVATTLEKIAPCR